MSRLIAAHTFLPQQQGKTGMMVCFAPPQHVVDGLQQDDLDAEPAHDLHVTLAYLGKTPEYNAQQLADLPEVVSSWAEAQSPRELTVQGSGTFLSPKEGEPHLLHALVNSQNLHRFQAGLVDHLKDHGYNPREDHGYVGHITLGYTKHDVRFLPKVTRMSWTARDVWTAIAGVRRQHSFAEK
jgi:2'-5' RNA ligase